MKNSIKSVLCVVLLIATLPNCVHTQNANRSHSKSYWQQRLHRVRIGMRRERVEQLLGGIPYAAEDGEAPYNAHTTFYALDAHWCAAITFDWHGYDPNPKRNPYSVFHFPDHHVITRPKLLFRDAALNAHLH